MLLEGLEQQEAQSPPSEDELHKNSTSQQLRQPTTRSSHDRIQGVADDMVPHDLSFGGPEGTRRPHMGGGENVQCSTAHQLRKYGERPKAKGKGGQDQVNQ